MIQRGGEQRIGELIQLSRIADAVDGGGNVRQVERLLRQQVRQNRPNQPDPGQRQVIKGDGEEGHLVGSHPRQCGCRTPFDFIANRGGAIFAMLVHHRLEARATEEGLPRGAFGGSQEPVAVTGALHGVKQVELRLPLLLDPFGFGEEHAGFGVPTGLLRGIRCRGASTHSLALVAALVGMGNRLAHRPRRPSTGPVSPPAR